MENDLLKKWTQLLKPIFPAHAKFRPSVDGDYYIVVGWKLSNDTNRPNKPSRKIKIKITEEAVEDYLQKESDQCAKADDNLKRFIEKKYREFNPDHNASKYKSPPVELWDYED